MQPWPALLSNKPSTTSFPLRLLTFCLNALIDISFHDAIVHELSELTQKVRSVKLHPGITECHAVASHQLTPFERQSFRLRYSALHGLLIYRCYFSELMF